MSLVREFKRRAGGLRDQILYGRERKRIKAEADLASSGWIAEVVDLLPQVATDPPDGTQMLVLSGEKQSQMGMWSSWSMMRFYPRGTLVIVDDGTLSDGTAKRWQRLVGNVRLVSKAEGDAAMAAHLADYPKLRAWTNAYFCGAKLGVFQSVMQDAPMIEFDTDTITYQGLPEQFRLYEPGSNLLWCDDSRRCYAYEDHLLEELIGDVVKIDQLPVKLNAGYLRSFRFSKEQLTLLETLLTRLEADPRTDPLRYWMHQTMIACIAANLGQSAKPLNVPDTIYRGTMRPNSVMRHFVGNPDIRPRFFTDGVPSLICEAQSLGQLPSDLRTSH